MTVNDIIESLPISDTAKSVAIDLSLSIGVSMVNQYEKSTMTVFITFVGFLILCIRLVRYFFDARKAFFDQQISQHNAEVLKGKEDTKIIELKKT